jgi:hypothetical protein
MDVDLDGDAGSTATTSDDRDLPVNPDADRSGDDRRQRWLTGSSTTKTA